MVTRIRAGCQRVSTRGCYLAPVPALIYPVNCINRTLPISVRSLRWLIASLITEALSMFATVSGETGTRLDNSEKTSASLPRRHRAASRDFAFRFSAFLQADKKNLVTYYSNRLCKTRTYNKTRLCISND